jgi:hypothetical protein
VVDQSLSILQQLQSHHRSVSRVVSGKSMSSCSCGIVADLDCLQRRYGRWIPRQASALTMFRMSSDRVVSDHRWLLGTRRTNGRTW